MNRHTKKFFGMVGFTLGTFLNIGILAALIFAAYTYTRRAFEYGKEFSQAFFEEKPFAEAAITLKDGATLQEVAAILEEEGIISNALIFQLEHMLKGNNIPFNAGTFTVNSDMSTNQIILALRRVMVETSHLTIRTREGWTIREIAEYLEENDIVSAEHFIEVSNTGNFRYSFLDNIPVRENRLEGYLFPDTYFISETPTPEEIIDKMLARFEDVFDFEYEIRAEEMGLTMDQVIIIASIIEMEVRRADERALASAVIHNRLSIGMQLEMCSTVQYVLEERKERLLIADTQINSPYNTYLHRGLPIGPISNPGRASIEAALNPADVNYLFFVLQNEETGQHFFTHDYNEHLRASQRYGQRSQ